MPWKLGWKHEYWNGPYITPRQHVVCVVTRVNFARYLSTRRPEDREDIEKLKQLRANRDE